jgi:membrane protease YdiL (CAAX protease family)
MGARYCVSAFRCGPSYHLDIVATVIGAYLGVLWLWTGNLMTPIVVHALYDFVALIYLLRVHKPES